jgi:hypothetical protein
MLIRVPLTSFPSQRLFPGDLSSGHIRVHRAEVYEAGAALRSGGEGGRGRAVVLHYRREKHDAKFCLRYRDPRAREALLRWVR